MDVICERRVFRTFHPLGALVIAAVLAFVPHLLRRGAVDHPLMTGRHGAAK